jgi:hypothetical protein
LTYSKWGVAALFPSHPVSPTAAAWVFASLAVVFVVSALTSQMRTRLDALPAAATFAIWLLASLSVFLFLPNHVYRYYMTIGLPALFGLLLLTIRVGCDRLRLPGLVSALLMTAMAAASVTSSFLYFRQIDLRGLNQSYVEGTNDLVRRGVTVITVRDALLATHATLPARAVLLFKGLEIWAFGKDAGPRVWYRDPTIRAYDTKNLLHASGQWFVDSPPETQSEQFTGAAPRRIALECCSVFLFELTGGALIERRLESLRP